VCDKPVRLAMCGGEYVEGVIGIGGDRWLEAHASAAKQVWCRRYACTNHTYCRWKGSVW